MPDRIGRRRLRIGRDKTRLPGISHAEAIAAVVDTREAPTLVIGIGAASLAQKAAICRK